MKCCVIEVIFLSPNIYTLFVCLTVNPVFRMPGYPLASQLPPNYNLRYNCEWCGQQYRFESGLSRHRKKCGGRYDLECKLCLKKFYRKDNLLKHLQTQTAHGNEGMILAAKLAQDKDFYNQWKML